MMRKKMGRRSVAARDIQDPRVAGSTPARSITPNDFSKLRRSMKSYGIARKDLIVTTAANLDDLIWNWNGRELLLSFPLHAVPKPNATLPGWRSRQRGDVERYKSFRDLVKLHLLAAHLEERAEIRLVAPIAVRILVLDWNPAADPDNVGGGILDALKPWPMLNDRWREICSLTIERTREPVPGCGFNVRLIGDFEKELTHATQEECGVEGCKICQDHGFLAVPSDRVRRDARVRRRASERR